MNTILSRRRKNTTDHFNFVGGVSKKDSSNFPDLKRTQTYTKRALPDQFMKGVGRALLRAVPHLAAEIASDLAAEMSIRLHSLGIGTSSLWLFLDTCSRSLECTNLDFDMSVMQINCEYKRSYGKLLTLSFLRARSRMYRRRCMQVESSGLAVFWFGPPQIEPRTPNITDANSKTHIFDHCDLHILKNQ